MQCNNFESTATIYINNIFYTYLFELKHSVKWKALWKYLQKKYW